MGYMAAVRSLGFLEIQNFNGQQGWGEHASSCQISWRSVKPLPRYGDFPMAAVRHLRFKFSNF